MSVSYQCQYCGGGDQVCRNPEHDFENTGGFNCFKARGIGCFQPECAIKIHHQKQYFEYKETKEFVKKYQHCYLSAKYDGRNISLFQNKQDTLGAMLGFTIPHMVELPFVLLDKDAQVESFPEEDKEIVWCDVMCWSCALDKKKEGCIELSWYTSTPQKKKKNLVTFSTSLQRSASLLSCQQLKHRTIQKKHSAPVLKRSLSH